MLVRIRLCIKVFTSKSVQKGLVKENTISKVFSKNISRSYQIRTQTLTRCLYKLNIYIYSLQACLFRFYALISVT